MRVLLLPVDGKVEDKKDFSGSLEDMQSYVGGLIEMMNIGHVNGKDIDIVFDEEGKLKDGVKDNFLITYEGDVVDVVKGNVIFTAIDGEGEKVDLEDEDVEYIKNLFPGRSILNFDLVER